MFSRVHSSNFTSTKLKTIIISADNWHLGSSSHWHWQQENTQKFLPGLQYPLSLIAFLSIIVTYSGANYKEILLATLRPLLSCFQTKLAGCGFIQFFPPVTALVGCQRRIWPPPFILPRCSSLASDQIKLLRSKRAKGQENLWSQVEKVRHGYGRPALGDFSSPLHNEELISFSWQEVMDWAHQKLPSNRFHRHSCPHAPQF